MKRSDRSLIYIYSEAENLFLQYNGTGGLGGGGGFITELLNYITRAKLVRLSAKVVGTLTRGFDYIYVYVRFALSRNILYKCV